MAWFWEKKDQPIEQKPVFALVPVGTATVTTPTVPQRPKGELWDKLEKLRSGPALIVFREEVKRIGYSDDGQLVIAINEKIKSVGGQP